MSKISLKVGVLVVHGDKLLLIKERHAKNKEYCWNIIKGTFNSKKDKDIFMTVHREALEEAGIKMSIKSFLDVMIKNREDHHTTVQLNLIANLVSKKFKLPSRKKQLKEDEDICEIKFFTKNELKKMGKGDFITERAFVATREWLKGKKSNISLLKFFQ
jgi:ADP-ribose pyrophosphatase YjhB (NUDIX family)